MLSVPGLVGMIQHHRAFYQDMADPVALLRGEGQTQLSQIWPYVFGAGAATDPEQGAKDRLIQATAFVD